MDKEGQTITGGIAISVLRAAADYVRHSGLEPTGLFEDCGIPSSWLEEPSRHVPATTVACLFDEASRRLEDSLFGLHVGQVTKPWHCGVLGPLLMCSETMGEALEHFLMYEPIVDGIGRTRLRGRRDSLLLTWTTMPGEGRPPRHIAEAKLSAWFAFFRWLSQYQYGLQCVYFEHPEPPERERYERLFRCPVHFGQPWTAFCLERSILELPLSLPDPMLRKVLQARAESQLAQLMQTRSQAFSALIRHHLEAMLHEGEPSLSELTRRLNVSPRTLQRRLSPEGHCYKSLLDEVRRDLALCYIENPDLALHTISGLLGFSDQSAFQRAFKRWTGSSPGQYRGQTH
ncbi:AraC family transcriptional regulator [Halomonadaceae bacterium KBTZ08]